MHLWIQIAEILAGFRQIALHVDAGRKEIGKQNDPLCPAFNTACAPLENTGLGQFQERSYDAAVRSAFVELIDQMVQVGIRHLLSATVSDEQEGSSRASDRIRC